MFDAQPGENGAIRLIGRFDASQVQKALPVFEIVRLTTLVDCTELQYISSAGLEVLLQTQRRLLDGGHALILANLNQHIRNVFHYAGFEHVFEIR